MTNAQRGDNGMVVEQRPEECQAASNHRGYTDSKISQQRKSKEAIAKYVVKYIIEDCMSIFLDAGSTIHQIGLRLFDDCSCRSGLTIMTNNMLVFEEFRERSVEMYEKGNFLSLSGGSYIQNHQALFGLAAEEALKAFNPHVVIIGVSGFVINDEDVPQGVFHHDIVSEVMTKRVIVQKPTSHRVIVCDYSKIGRPDASRIATIQDLAAQNAKRCTIVTSIVIEDPCSPLSEEDREEYNRLYTETRIALQRLNLDNVEMIRVDETGEKAV